MSGLYPTFLYSVLLTCIESDAPISSFNVLVILLFSTAGTFRNPVGHRTQEPVQPPAGRDFPALSFEGVDMSTMVFPDLPNGNHPKHSETLGIGRRPAAMTLASSLWPSSSELFTEDFLTDSGDEDSNELRNLLAQIEAFSGSVHSGTSDLFKFRELLLEAAHSVFMRWKVLHQLRTMALTDELTSLYNRRGFLLLGMHYLRLARRNAPLSLYFADVDGLIAAVADAG